MTLGDGRLTLGQCFVLKKPQPLPNMHPNESSSTLESLQLEVSARCMHGASEHYLSFPGRHARWSFELTRGQFISAHQSHVHEVCHFCSAIMQYRISQI